MNKIRIFEPENGKNSRTLRLSFKSCVIIKKTCKTIKVIHVLGEILGCFQPLGFLNVSLYFEKLFKIKGYSKFKIN